MPPTGPRAGHSSGLPMSHCVVAAAGYLCECGEAFLDILATCGRIRSGLPFIFALPGCTLACSGLEMRTNDSRCINQPHRDLWLRKTPTFSLACVVGRSDGRDVGQPATCGWLSFVWFTNVDVVRTEWGGRLRKRFCNMFSESSTGSWAELQLPCCPRKQGELQENMLQNLLHSLLPQTVY